MQLSKTTYDYLPYAYIGGGLLNAMLLQSQLKFLPTLILVCAGLLIIGWRRSARMRGQRIRAAGRAVRRSRQRLG